jgi:ubiquinone/menaquinone biosynthesis C-methylase UbiE
MTGRMAIRFHFLGVISRKFYSSDHKGCISFDPTFSHMDVKLLSSMFEGLPRQGPGSDESTAHAFSLIPSDARRGIILDIGCGSGMQTLALARLCPSCSIVATDVYQPFLDDLTGKVTRSGLTEKIKILQASMDDLPLTEHSFDIIWSEGAAFIMGVIPALTCWKKFLKPDGYLVVSDCFWFTDIPSEECRNFWNEIDPGLKTEDDIASSIRGLGYSVVAHFRLPAEAWWDNFYNPLARKLVLLREKYAGNDEAGDILTGFEKEMDIFRKYSDEYGYTFFVLQNTPGLHQVENGLPETFK